jgi:hypothetical protein
MIRDISLPLSTPDVNVESATTIDHQPLIHENDPIVPLSRDYRPNPPSSYLSMSIGDNRQFGLSDFQDPLFYQQPLHLHYNQPLPFKVDSEHETGDRIRGVNKFKLNEHRKSRSVTSRKNGSKKSKSKLVKTKQNKKRNTKERKQKIKRVNRNSIQQLRNQVTIYTVISLS